MSRIFVFLSFINVEKLCSVIKKHPQPKIREHKPINNCNKNGPPNIYKTSQVLADPPGVEPNDVITNKLCKVVDNLDELELLRGIDIYGSPFSIVRLFLL